jgi:signal recognition particle subunit SRP54
MGDVVGLVRDFEQVVDTQQAEADAERLLAGRFGMDDLLSQLRTLQKMGSLRDLLGKLPGVGEMAEQVDERELVKTQAMIQSMTPLERAGRSGSTKAAPRASRAAAGAPHARCATWSRFRQMRT